MPPTVKELLKWAKYYFYTHFAIRPTIVKLSAYPITDLVYTGDPELVVKWKYALDTRLNIKSHFINAGLDKLAMGNNVSTMYFPFQRRLKCPSCKMRRVITGDPDEKWWDFKDLRWKGMCPECRAGIEYLVEDQFVPDIDLMNIIRLSIENIDVIFNEITGRSRYFYNIPQKTKRAVLSNDKSVIAELPLRFIQAIKEDKAIQLHPKNVFHMKEESLAEEDQGYGKPIILSAMKDAFYLQILRKANEAIALQHIVPLTVLFPEPNASFDPYRHMNLADWRANVEEELLRWKDDMNHVPIMPGPLGAKQIFGDAKALMVTPEIRAITEQIVTGMGVPQEFVFGGMQWSGSHVSLRMIENQLLRHREQMSRMLGFIVDHLSKFLNLRKIDIKFADFKMADDIQLKQILGNMVQGKMYSKQSYTQEFGKDWQVEQPQILKETDFETELTKRQLIGQAEAQGQAMQVTSRFQTKAELERKRVLESEQKKDAVEQLEATVELQKDQQAAQAGQPGATAQAPGGPQAAAQAQQAAQARPTAQQPAQAAAAPPQQAQPQPARRGESLQGGLTVPPQGAEATKPGDHGIDLRSVAVQFASKLNDMDPHQRDRVLQQMKDQTPNLYQLVIAQRQIERDRGVLNKVDRPMPQVKPPRRELLQ